MKRWHLGMAGLVGILIVVGWFVLSRSTRDRQAALAANAQGIAWMERFDYPVAAEAFAEAMRRDSTWLVPRINHAIALLNTATDPNLDQARQELLAIVQDHPDEPHAHYGIGVIALHRNHTEEAREHFEAVTRIDPADPAAWYHLGSTYPPGDPEATRCLERAYALDPYLGPALYGLAMNLRRQDPNRAAKLLDEQKRLVEAGVEDVVRIRYAEMGRYGDVIDPVDPAPVTPGPLPTWKPDGTFRVTLTEGVRWLGSDDTLPPAIQEARRRFGGTLVPLDIDGDGRLDLFLAAAVIAQGRPRDLLLHQRDAGQFVDVTTPAGLDGVSIGAAVGDFDNDGRPDLVLTTTNGIRLLRNQGDRTFADMTAAAGCDVIQGLCLGASWLDLDQDGDLDLVVSRPADAGGVAVLLNAGEAPVIAAGQPPPPLAAKFLVREIPGLSGIGATVTLASDIDLDRDLDLVVLTGTDTPHLARNERLLRFQGQPLSLPGPAVNGISGLVLDPNHDGRSDLVILAENAPPRLVVNRPHIGDGRPSMRWQEGTVNSPPLRQASAIDFDLDGGTDLIGLSHTGQLVILHNRDGELLQQPAVPGTDGLIGVTLISGDDQGTPAVVAWSTANGLSLLKQQGNTNHALRVSLTGRRDRGTGLRSNADGVGAWALVQAGVRRTGIENTTLSAGLGQARLPLVFGLGSARSADTLRIRWPDGVPQAELDLASGPVVRVEETSRKTTSCPVLFSWDGSEYQFVTDFLGAGALGELQPDGTERQPRDEETLLIDPPPVVTVDGTVRLKIAEPLDEVLFLDQVRLIVVDHPADTVAVPDERFPGAGPEPSGRIEILSAPIVPIRAVGPDGEDVTHALLRRDGIEVRPQRRRSWLGYADDTILELDFGTRLAHLRPSDPVVLELVGWTDYPYPESIWAASQAGVPLQPPVLERLQPDGRWSELGVLGFPAGLPRTITRDVTGWLTGPTCRLRLRSNMQIGWDQLAVRTRVATEPDITMTTLRPQSSQLAANGLAREQGTGGLGPIRYDDRSRDRVAVSSWLGRFTPEGEVTELVRERDGRSVIVGPGREVELVFAVAGLPKLQLGWRRTHVLRAVGTTRDTSPLTTQGGYVLPPAR